MAKQSLCIRANNRKNGIVNRHLQATPDNCFECFEETVRRRKNHGRWGKELEIKVEELIRVGVHDPIYELLLNENGVIEKWARDFGNRKHIDWHELFSDFQLYLYEMLDGRQPKAYNRNISFMNNLYKQLESLTKDKRKYHDAKKRKDDWNCIPSERLEQIPDYRDNYSDREFIDELQKLDCSDIDKRIIIGLASGQISKKDIPAILNWTNTDDRKKLSRYMKKLAQVIAQL